MMYKTVKWQNIFHVLPTSREVVESIGNRWLWSVLYQCVFIIYHDVRTRISHGVVTLTRRKFPHTVYRLLAHLIHSTPHMNKLEHQAERRTNSLYRFMCARSSSVWLHRLFIRNDLWIMFKLSGVVILLLKISEFYFPHRNFTSGFVSQVSVDQIRSELWCVFTPRRLKSTFFLQLCSFLRNLLVWRARVSLISRCCCHCWLEVSLMGRRTARFSPKVD